MTVLSAQSIRERCQRLIDRRPNIPMIEPFNEETTFDGMTFGLSAASYDVRIAQTFSLMPGEFRLASTMERFNIPNDLIAMVADKSTWARRGIAVQHTLIDPGWNGFLTLELSNHSALIVDIKAGMPIAQLAFHLLDKPTDQPYVGRYQNQEAGPQPAIFHDYQPSFPLDPENVMPWDNDSNLGAIEYIDGTTTNYEIPISSPRMKLEHIWSRQNDEYACKCGVRWPVEDGDDHP